MEDYTESDRITPTPPTTNPIDSWLPITQSRSGNAFTSTFHLLCSGIGLQALLLPVAFASLGWSWGLVCLLMAFIWQLYTIWILVQLHESVLGTRFSRYLQLSIASFGGKLGKLLAIFPTMYLSGGSCVMLIITGGTTMKLFYQIISADWSTSYAKLLSGAEWYLVFTCLAILIALVLPNLNSLSGVSLIGAVTGVSYCSLIWIVSLARDRPQGITHDPSKNVSWDVERIAGILNALGIVVLAFRGHNVILEIQGTMPSNQKHPSREPMMKGVITSYIIIASSLFPLAICGYWAYGDMIPQNGMLSALTEFHGQKTAKSVMGITYSLVIMNCLCTYQIFAVPAFDNLEFRYVLTKNKPCSPWIRKGIRAFFGGLTYLISVAFPFLGSLAALIGGLAMPLTYAYPCFMWVLIKKPKSYSTIWFVNLGLGCLGMVLSALLVSAALWNLVYKGLDANFFNPR
ncbi:Amino acid transporter, transmembrane domain [Dillenia turbinata]|uniref:Amino acid transporter, transmembrane domain n=1 Tax=Dillenia turbinata TaxID=194707 RepID=A0AAN8W770_9MAGN